MKELEALNYVWYNYYTEELSQDEVKEIEKNLNIVQDGLKRLEAIDNAKPSEAMECLERIIITKPYKTFDEFDNDYKTIKQYILKAQELEKVLEIIKEKNVLINGLKHSMTLGLYNKCLDDDMILTQDEFELLKRWSE